ncbi:MAG: O-antigen ligase family protein [Polaribacter sp.]|nr:O-antigen ligase family protein [Polaribacter sp.]MDG1811761.1 O-antigen ligase family protein [Polaribacter sp.]MDG1994694.1 O-antigen ligase family protein [Polaribacter sp.]
MKLKTVTNKQNIFDTLFALLAFTLPLSFALPNILLLLVFSLFVIKKNKERLNTYVKLVLLFGLFFILKALFNKELSQNFFIYKHLIVFTAISFLAFNIKNIILVKKTFVFGVLSAVLFSFFKITAYYVENQSIPLGNTSEATELLIIHRPYFGFICFLAIMCCSSLINEIKTSKQKVFYKLSIVLFIGFVYLIVARLALGLILIYLFILAFQQYKLSKKKIVLFVGLFSSLLFMLVINNKNLKKRLHIENSFDKTIKVIANQEPRVVIWGCFLGLIKKSDFNYLTGYKSIKSIQSDLNDCYKNTIENVSKNTYYQKTKFNTHNQFLDFFLQGGLIGFLLFIIILGYSFYSNRFNFTTIFIIFSFVSFLLLENLFHRQLGVYLIGIFIPLFMKRNVGKVLHGN